MKNEVRKIIKDGTTKPFKEGDYVIYIPDYLLNGPKNEMIKDKNLGIVTSKNDTYVFVKYFGNNGSQATRPDELFSLHNRLDLCIKLDNSFKSLTETEKGE